MVPILPKKNFFLGSPARPELFTRMRGPSEKSYPYGFAQGDWPNWPILGGPKIWNFQIVSKCGRAYTLNTRDFTLISNIQGSRSNSSPVKS